MDDAPAMFSVIPMTEDINDLPLPDNGPYYILGKGRLYIHKRIFQGRTILPVKEIPTIPDPLTDKKGFFWYDEDKITLPGDLVGMVWSFFRSIYNQRGSEAMVFLTWHKDHGVRVFVPPQHASHGGVQSQFNPEHLTPGTRVIGTIHSHCDFDAFHSGTDTHDAEGHDGLHMTIGKVKSNPPQIATMVSIGGQSWDFQPDQVIDGELIFTKHPRWWERYVSDPAPINKGKHVSNWEPRQTAIGFPTRSNPMKVGGSQMPIPFDDEEMEAWKAWMGIRGDETGMMTTPSRPGSTDTTKSTAGSSTHRRHPTSTDQEEHSPTAPPLLPSHYLFLLADRLKKLNIPDEDEAEFDAITIDSADLIDVAVEDLAKVGINVRVEFEYASADSEGNTIRQIFDD